jgi:hypothetical protein
MDKTKRYGLGNDLGLLLERRERKNQNNGVSEPLNRVLIEDIYYATKRQPRISFWDLKSKTLLNYLKETQPKFSISKEISNILQEHFKKSHPEIWKEIEKLM